jgi:hypothetical protein
MVSPYFQLEVANCNLKLATNAASTLNTKPEAGCGGIDQTSSENYVTLTSVYVPYTCRNASQISPTVA